MVAQRQPRVVQIQQNSSWGAGTGSRPGCFQQEVDSLQAAGGCVEAVRCFDAAVVACVCVLS